MVGAKLGLELGFKECAADGPSECAMVGSKVGTILGDALGLSLGSDWDSSTEIHSMSW
jgi:hypothetical protein